MPGHAMTTYGHCWLSILKLHGKLSPRIARAIHKNTVKNSKKRRLFWSGVAETRWFFSLSSSHTRRRFAACGKLERETWGNTQVGRGASFDQSEYSGSGRGASPGIAGPRCRN